MLAVSSPFPPPPIPFPFLAGWSGNAKGELDERQRPLVGVGNGPTGIVVGTFEVMMPFPFMTSE